MPGLKDVAELGQVVLRSSATPRVGSYCGSLAVGDGHQRGSCDNHDLAPLRFVTAAHAQDANDGSMYAEAKNA
jgi:hypothetical protein